MSFSRLAAAAAVIIASSAIARSPEVAVTVTIDTNRTGIKIDRNIHGQMAEHKGTLIYDGIWVGEDSKIPNTGGIRNDVVSALRKISVPVVRWPGGCFADAYHWRDGIGPREQRPRKINLYGQKDPNHFGTHEFMDFAEQIGAEPYVSVNVGSGTVQETSDWLEYLTASEGSLADLRRENGRREPWKVKYVGLGNEVWGCGGNMRADYYADNLRRYSLFLSDNPLADQPYLIASGPLNDDYEWTRSLIKVSSWTYPHSDIRIQYFHGMSLHFYTFPNGEWLPTKNQERATGFSEDQWFSTLHTALRMDELLTRHGAVMDQFDPKKEVALIVDEWGAWYASESDPHANLQQNSLRDALVAALTLNVFHRHSDRVKMANISMMINVFQAMILTDKERVLLTPTYHVFDLYQPFQDATPFATDISGANYRSNDRELPVVDVSAAKGKDGKIYLALVNLDPNRSARITTNLSGEASGRLVTGPRIDSHNTFDEPFEVRPMPFVGRVDAGGRLGFLMPAKSVAVVAVQ